MAGTAVDDTPLLVRGVVVARTEVDRVAQANFYLDPVEQDGWSSREVRELPAGQREMEESRSENPCPHSHPSATAEPFHLARPRVPRGR